MLIATIAAVLLLAGPSIAAAVPSAAPPLPVDHEGVPSAEGGAAPQAAGDQNLVTNPGFDSNLAGWMASGATWGPADASGSTTSGSARLMAFAQPGQCTNNVTLRQCVPVDQPAYDFKTMLQGGRGYLGISLSFHEGNDCTGPTVPEASVGYSLFFADTRWVPFTSRLFRPTAAQSIDLSALAFTCAPCSLPNPACLGGIDAGIDDVSLKLAPPPVPARFYTLPPCRLFDTRSADGPSLDAGAERRIPTTGRCGIPPLATALALNLTVTGPTDAGNLRVYMPGVAPLASTLNYSLGQTRANSAVAALGVDGWLSVRADQAVGTVHLIVDVTGYFE